MPKYLYSTQRFAGYFIYGGRYLVLNVLENLSTTNRERFDVALCPYVQVYWR